MDYSEAEKKLRDYGQEHILRYYDGLDDDEKKALLSQIKETDFGILSYIEGKDKVQRGVFSPLDALSIPQINERRDEYYEEGARIIKDGKAACLLLAGGMGTRLGADGPKGAFDLGKTHPVYVFQRLIENLMDVTVPLAVKIHLFIMTSEKNHARTVDFMKEHDYFGYDPSFVHFFPQEMAPACDYNGKVYMEEKGRIATSPNGNAGWYSSLKRAGLDSILRDEGIEYINVFAVDNVLQRMADPVFIGATSLKGCQVGAKVVRKVSPDEKVGVICLEDGRPSIVEYYELSDEMKDAKDAEGG